MEIISTVAGMIVAREGAERPLGLVPTMGALHDGHLALVERAMRENRTVTVSIFVNPAQFGPLEDIAGYPRDIDHDLDMLKAKGIHTVFTPPVEEMYPDGYSTHVDVQGATARLEGERRLGHFRGVATVVTKLLTIVRPDRSYFGQKDGQQAAVIQRLNRDLNLGSEIVVVPTVREPDGLAMSSRNAYLTEEERRAAPVLYRALCRVQKLWEQGQRDVEVLRREMIGTITAESLARLDYASIADAVTLEELQRVDRTAMVSLAVRFGKARLIDNIIIHGA